MNTLSLEDILLLWYVDNRAVGFAVPQYWHYTYKVDDVLQRLQRYRDYRLLTTQTVKNKEKYTATAEGKRIIDAHPHIVYYHTYRNTLDPQLTLHTVHNLYNASKWETVEDLFIAYHNSVMGDYWENKQYGLARNALLSIAEIDFRRAKYAEALANFLSVSYLDMTGLDNFTQYRTEFTAEDKENLQLAPGIMSYVTICLRNTGATVNDLSDAYSLAVQNIDVAYAAYSKQEVLSLIAEEINKLWNT